VSIAADAADGPLVVVWLPRGKEMLAATISKVAIRIICLLQNKRLPTIIAEVYRKKKRALLFEERPWVKGCNQVRR